MPGLSEGGRGKPWISDKNQATKTEQRFKYGGRLSPENWMESEGVGKTWISDDRRRGKEIGFDRRQWLDFWVKKQKH
jgi:hypothetical protein